MPDDQLRSILDDPRVEIFAFRQGEQDVGILVLDFREPKTCELVFFGDGGRNWERHRPDPDERSA